MHDPTHLTDQLRSLGVRRGGVLVVHMSYRAVRPVHRGPLGVIDALRAAVGTDGTIVMPSWGDDDEMPLDPANTPADASLGATADIFWRLPGTHRSAHSFAFAALGPRAELITGDPLPTPPHGLDSPIGRAYEHDAQILLLGVGHDSNTTIHLAEVLAGVPYGVPKHCTIMKDGRPTRVDYVENDHCCERFALADLWLREAGLQREGRVGQARALLMNARDLVRVVREQLERNPLIFLHGAESACAECDEARRSTL
ncbi:MAG: AAC(3) family N-acetyltransferase [bacterium]